MGFYNNRLCAKFAHTLMSWWCVNLQVLPGQPEEGEWQRPEQTVWSHPQIVIPHGMTGDHTPSALPQLFLLIAGVYFLALESINAKQWFKHYCHSLHILHRWASLVSRLLNPHPPMPQSLRGTWEWCYSYMGQQDTSSSKYRYYGNFKIESLFST